MSKKSAKRRKGAAGGYLLDDFKDLDTESMGGGAAGANKRSASRAQIEETYFRKKRRERYRDVDVDYDVSQEPTGRYTTRRAAAALGARTSTRLQDVQTRKKSNLGRSDSFAGQQRAAGVTGVVVWTKQEDELLLAIAHEFSGNWTLVSEVLSLSLSMQGIYRPPAMCKQRFRQITTPESGEYNEELALMNLSQTLTKQQAREMLMASLPVRDDVLMPLMEALVQIGAAAKQRRQAEEKKNDPVRTRRQEPHTSHALVHAAVMQQTGNRTMTPLELGEAVNAAYSQQAKTQQLLTQAMQAQTAAAGPAPPQPPGQVAGKLPGQPAAGAPGVAAAAAAAQAAAQQPQQPGMVAPPGTQPAPAATTPAALPMQSAPGMSGGMATPLGAAQLQMPPGSAATRPMMPPQGVTPQAMAQAQAAAAAAMAQQQQQQQQQGTPGAAVQAGMTPGGPMALPQQPGGTPGQAPGLAPGQMQQQQLVARQAAAAAAQQAHGRPPAVTLQQLNHILATNLLPNGTALPPEMRKQIEEKRNSYLAKTQAQQAQLTAQARQQQQQQVNAAIALQQQHAAAAAAAAAAHSAAAGAQGGGPGQPGSAQVPQQQQPGAPPGTLPASAAAVALHAAQQAVAMQQQQAAAQQQGGVAAGQAPAAGVRPPGLPPGLYAVQGLQPGASLALASGAGGQPMALPPGVMPSVSHQMSLAAAQGGMPSLQPAMALQSAQLAAAAHLGAAQGGTPGAPGTLPASLPPGMQQQQLLAAQQAQAAANPQQVQAQLAQFHQQQLQHAAAAAAAQQAAANQAAAAAAQQAAAAPQQQHVQGS